MNRENFQIRQNEECPETCCPNTGELAPNFGFEGNFVASDSDLVPVGWSGTNVDQEKVQQKIHSGLKAVVLGRTPSADAVLTSQLLTTDVIPGCFYILAFHAGGTGPSILTAQLIFINSMGGQTVGGQIQVIGASKVANVGVFYRGIFGPVPSDLAAVQIKFTKTGTGSIDLDDVSLTIA